MGDPLRAEAARPWDIRPATAADLAAVQAVGAACSEAPQWRGAVWLGYVTPGGEAVQRWLAVCDAGDGVVGFVAGTCLESVAELESVAVLPEARRRGIARALCVGFAQWAAGQGAGRVELEVRARSNGARELYRSMGFVEDGRRRAYYGDPVDDAVLMSLQLEEQGNGESEL